MAKKKKSRKSELVGFLGVGLDHADDEHRITRCENFFLVGGSSSTHEQMQDTAIRFNENLQRRGKALGETSVEEAIEIFFESREN